MVNTKAALRAQIAWFPFLFFAGIAVLGADPARELYDERYRPRPFVTAIVDVVENLNRKPTVMYAAWANDHVDGMWSAWVSIAGRRGCGGSGFAGYGASKKQAVPWEWSDWLGKDCPVPLEPYALCVRYSVRTARGVGDISGPFCSLTINRTKGPK